MSRSSIQRVIPIVPDGRDAGAWIYDEITREVRRWQAMNNVNQLHEPTFTLPVEQTGNVRCRICHKELTAVDVVNNERCPGASNGEGAP